MGYLSVIHNLFLLYKFYTSVLRNKASSEGLRTSVNGISTTLFRPFTIRDANKDYVRMACYAASSRRGGCKRGT